METIVNLVNKLSSCNSWGKNGFYTTETGRNDYETTRLITENKELIISAFGSLSGFASYLFGIVEMRNYLLHSLHGAKTAGLCDLEQLRKNIKIKKLRAERIKFEWENFNALSHSEQINLINSFCVKENLIKDYSQEA
jgi:hypothetical protein